MKNLITILILVLTSCGDVNTPVEDEKSKDSLTMDTIAALLKSNGPMYSMEAIYENYISAELQAYITRSHPLWSIPSENKWYPKLFMKYKTATSLVNIISGDFDCNGKKDYALLLDKGGILGAVAFLSKGDSFSTVELTENLKKGEDKIEFVLTLFKPGRYATEDPDTEPALRHVNLKCDGIGIGLFKELYEGGNDVYYWDNGQLRSCLIGH